MPNLLLSFGLSRSRTAFFHSSLNFTAGRGSWISMRTCVGTTAISM